jgi:hypothetical protein
MEPKDPIPKESGGALGVHHVGDGNMRGVVDKRGLSASGISISDGSYCSGVAGRLEIGIARR